MANHVIANRSASADLSGDGYSVNLNPTNLYKWLGVSLLMMVLSACASVPVERTPPPREPIIVDGKSQPLPQAPDLQTEPLQKGQVMSLSLIHI